MFLLNFWYFFSGVCVTILLYRLTNCMFPIITIMCFISAFFPHLIIHSTSSISVVDSLFSFTIFSHILHDYFLTYFNGRPCCLLLLKLRRLTPSENHMANILKLNYASRVAQAFIEFLIQFLALLRLINVDVSYVIIKYNEGPVLAFLVRGVPSKTERLLAPASNKFVYTYCMVFLLLVTILKFKIKK